MGRYYRIEEGDCLSSLARQHGFKSYHRIYDDPANADLRKKRPNPNLLYPGDVVFIPDLDHKHQSGATDTRHVFRLVRPKVKLRVKLLDKKGQPYKYKKYRVDVAEKQFFGHTTSKGLVQEQIPADATEGTLHLWLADEEAEHATTTMPLRIGYLDPVDEITGVQARLNHLGFDCGAVDGILGPKTAAALAAFQKSAGLKQTGELDAATRGKLQHAHDDE